MECHSRSYPITSLSATSGSIGSPITITGTGFGASQGSSTVSFNGTTATPTSWSTGSITVPVPSGARNGNVVVTVGGISSSGIGFTVLNGSFVATTGQMTNGVYGQTATQLTSGQVLIAGGISSSGVLNGIALYNPSNQTFAAASPMNVARWLHTATLLNDGTVLIAGGSSFSDQTTLNSAEIYDPVAGTSTLLPSTLNTARVGHTATLLGTGQVLIVGGYDPTRGIIADAELYDPSAQVFIDLGNTNTPRFHHTATLLQNGQVLIAGGETDPTPSGAYNNAELFNPRTWVFSPVSASMVSSREGHTATVLNDGTVLIAGGDLPGAGSLTTAEIYNPSASTFTAVSGTMTSARIFHDAVLLNGGKVLLLGGESDSGGTSAALNTAELYDPTAPTFTAVGGNMTSAREHQTATLLNDGTVLETGGTDGTNFFNTAEIYTTSKLTGLASISISPTSPTVPLGSQQLLMATGTFSGGSTQVLSSVLWSSSSTAVGTTSNDSTDSGFVVTATQGTATITASAAGISGSATLTVPAPALVSITLNPQAPTMPLGTTLQFTPIGTYSDGSTQDLTSTAVWTSSSSSTTVSSGGLVTAAAFGTGTIQASAGSQSASTTVTVTSPALVALAVSPATGTLSIGVTQQYQAVGTYTDGSTQNLTSSVSWFAVPQTSASINSSGLVTAVAQGNVNITAAYGRFSGIATLTVGSANLTSISVLPGTASISIGAVQQFTALGSYSDGSVQDITGSTTWTSSNGMASNVSSSGLATALAGGSTTISASRGSVTATASLSVQTGTIALNTSRYQHSATVLDNGSVLISGGVSCPSAGSCTYLNSAELYNPASGTITNTGSMASARTAPAVLLGNGKVLITGGYSCDASGNCSSLSSSEIYDPNTGTFSSAGNMTIDRYEHTMTLLSNGQVLIAGGETCSSATSCTALNSGELYDPVAGTFTATGNLNAARFGASAVALSSGQVLIAGGFDGINYPVTSELFDPTAGTFKTGRSLNTPRANATATVLNNGQVMIAGGSTCNSPGCPTAVTELYASGRFSYPTYPTGNMDASRWDQTATLLSNGQVFFAGGYDSCSTLCVSDATTELFDPLAFTFTTSQALSTGRSGHTATLLADGSVLLVGGINNGLTLSSTDSYQPASLALPALASISISPSNPPIAVGANVTFTATGYNSGGGVWNNSKSPLQSVIWNSSSPSVATISNAPGSAGIVQALSSGTTTITATIGTITASTDVTVTSSLVSITVTPSNPTVAANSTQTLQLTSTGNYSDGSTQNLTSDVTWSSSNTSIAAVFDVPGNPAVLIPVASGSATIKASYTGVSGTTPVTVTMPLAPVPPLVTGVSPTSGAAGTQVTITGSGFGATRGNGTVWLGTTLGAVISWSDSQVFATVSTGSSSGVAQIQQSNGASNSVSFTINTAVINSISPNNGLVGTQVTITGTGFGATQGNGNVWLGTLPAIVSSWSDGEIIATVAAGAATGNAVVLQNGVMTNAVPFTINLPVITSISPNNGAAGTMVTVTGSGFGTAQGSGTVWIGSTYGSVVGWSDTQMVASVGSNALSGIVKIEQNGTWSNAVTFTVPGNLGTGGGSTSVTLVPNLLNLLVGGTQTMQALDANGNSVTGLTWTSSNISVVTLSNDDPPILTAVAAGSATITAGNASADVTVWAGSTLPLGTVIWSNPGDGSGVSSIVPAVPSSTGVADVFAANADGNVQAIRADGTTAWTQNVGTSSSLIPDFQGGSLVYNGSAISGLDGMTGQPSSWQYTSASGNALSTPVPHTDGTIFTIDGSSVTAIDPTSGQPKFSIATENSTSTFTSSGGGGSQCLAVLPPGGFTSGNVRKRAGTASQTRPSSARAASAGKALPAASLTPWQFDPFTNSTSPATLGDLIIAGDGYAYVPYLYATSTGGSAATPPNGCKPGTLLYEYYVMTQHLRLLRVGSGGDSYSIPLGDYESSYSVTTQTASSVNVSSVNLITNADQGVLASWEVDTSVGYSSNTTTSAFNLATTSGTSVSISPMNVPGQVAPVEPVLQRADGSYIGTYQPSTGGAAMLAFTAAGQQLWSQLNYTPQIATAGGGVIAQNIQTNQSVTFDSNGNQTGQIGNLGTYSWTGASYQTGSIDSFKALSLELEDSYSGFSDANASHNNSAVNDFPPLPTQAGNAIWNAYQDLVFRLTNSKSCSGAAQLNVFDKLNKDPAFRGDTNHNPINTANFLIYLSKTPHFYDGTQSTWDSKNALCGSGRPWWSFQSLNCSAPIGYPPTIKASFQDDATQSAATETPSYPLTVFFRPSGTYAIQLANNGKSAFNEAMFFHEALHGITGQGDKNLQAVFGNQLSDSSSVITDYIQSHVLNVCPVTAP